MGSEFESDPQDTVEWGKKGLVDFKFGKTQLVLFDWSVDTGAIDMKMDGSALEEKLSFKMLGLTFSSKLDWGFYIISIAKPATKKIVAFICSLKFLSSEVALYFFKSTIRSAWNTFVMSGLVLLVATGNYWIRYRSGCARLLVLHLLSNLNSWLIVEL